MEKRKTIWFLNQNSYLPEDGPHVRHFALAKYLAERGYDTYVFAGNELHHNGRTIETGDGGYTEKVVDGVHFVYVKTTHYEKNDVKRILNIASYRFNVIKVCGKFAKKCGKPDYIYASSMYPTAIAAGITLARKYGAPLISESRDLVPEGFTKEGALKPDGVIAKSAEKYMKRLYERSDALVFTFSGGNDYIAGKGWDIPHGGKIDPEKIFYINNGVDLKESRKNAEEYVLKDADLDDEKTKCVVYLGAIRFMNNMPLFMDTAEKLKEKGREDIKLLLWGTGTKVEEMQKELDDRGLDNLILKGYVEKKYVPGIAKRADLFIGTGNSTNMTYGMSFNKLFDYMAAAKPVILPFKVGRSIVEAEHAGTELAEATGEALADEIIRFIDMDPAEYESYCKDCGKLAERYDYEALASDVEKIITILDRERNKG